MLKDVISSHDRKAQPFKSASNYSLDEIESHIRPLIESATASERAGHHSGRAGQHSPERDQTRDESSFHTVQSERPEAVASVGDRVPSRLASGERDVTGAGGTSLNSSHA